MVDFKPNHYYRLMARHVQPNVNRVEYILDDKIDDPNPNYTIIPAQVKIIMTIDGEIREEVLIMWMNKIYEASPRGKNNQGKTVISHLLWGPVCHDFY